MNNSIRVRIKGQNLRLLPQKAVYWEEEKALIISDLQLGKVTTHKKEGNPVPSNGVEKNFDRLSELMREYNVERVIFTGDLFNGKENEEWRKFTSWRNDHSSVEMEMVIGGQDQLSRSHYDTTTFTVNNSELTIPPFTFCHHPPEGISFENISSADISIPSSASRVSPAKMFAYPVFILVECRPYFPALAILQ